MRELLSKYYKLLEEIKSLKGIVALLSWDQENQMPPLAVSSRAKQRGLIEKLVHQKLTSSDYIKIVFELNSKKELLNSIDSRSVSISNKEIIKSLKLPSDFVEEFANLKSKTQQAWIDAKTNEDFKLYQPLLEEMFEYTRRYAAYIDDSKPIYDVLLDDYEEGMTTNKLHKIFKELKTNLKEILKKVKAKESSHVFTSSIFEKNKTEKLIKEITNKLGFNYAKGVLGDVHHPFETKISNEDVRINVKYSEHDLAFTLTGAIHELGHGLYEQNISHKYEHTAFSEGASLTIHESQSRLLENMIGRSKEFWEFFFPVITNYYPELKNFTYEDATNDLNIIKSTFIRTEADEITYNLHIILRFEIELMILNKEIDIKDLPQVWNNKMEELLGIRPVNLSEGCLQDVHWSIGAIGYFPTYSLGNLASAQLWHKFKNDNLDFKNKFKKGDFSSYFNWFKNNIWQYGSLYTSEEFLNNSTDEPLVAKYLIEYIKEKYL